MTALRRALAFLASGPAPALGFYLLAALALRLPAVCCSRGYEFLDHQFQYVDPAYHLAFDADWWRPWEYERGMRSWVYPGLLAGMFRGLHALGLTDPALRMAATRGLHALFGLLPLLALWHLVVRWRPIPQARPVLAFAACSGLFVYTGVQPNGPMWAAQFSVTAVLLAYGPRPWHAGLAGLALGLAVAGRVQDLAFAPAIGLWLLWQRRWLAAVLFSVGVFAMLALQGLVDLWTWGSFLHSLIDYLRANLTEGHAANFGRAPAWEYLPAVVAVTALVPFVRPAWAALREGVVRYPLLALAAAFYLVAHSVLDRKAVRFVMPGLMLASLVAVVGAFAPTLQAPRLRAHRRWLVGLHVACALALSFVYFHRGAVEAARALAARSDFAGKLLLVSIAPLGEAAIGGYYYLDRQRLEVIRAPHDALGGALATAGVDRIYALVERLPLTPQQVPAGWAADELGEFTDWPEFSSRRRRFVYLLRRVG